MASPLTLPLDPVFEKFKLSKFVPNWDIFQKKYLEFSLAKTKTKHYHVFQASPHQNFVDVNTATVYLQK